MTTGRINQVALLADVGARGPGASAPPSVARMSSIGAKEGPSPKGGDPLPAACSESLSPSEEAWASPGDARERAPRTTNPALWITRGHQRNKFEGSVRRSCDIRLENSV